MAKALEKEEDVQQRAQAGIEPGVAPTSYTLYKVSCRVATLMRF